MKIRRLEEKDAEFMLEWMHDKSVVENLFTDFSHKNKEDCLFFIYESLKDTDDIHLAIVDNNDRYMGTVSLKHIDNNVKNAEFAITVRKGAMGKGYSIFGMKKIFEIAKQELKLDTIYWCVLKDNLRAIRFYNKNGFKLSSEIPSNFVQYYCEEVRKNLVWYCIQL